MARSINDGYVVLIGLKFPQSNINGDATFSLGLQFVQHPGILEGAFAHLFMIENTITILKCLTNECLAEQKFKIEPKQSEPQSIMVITISCNIKGQPGLIKRLLTSQDSKIAVLVGARSF